MRDGVLEADVDVGNLTGHKLPTGYPSRRVWLHVTVRDADRRGRCSNRARSTAGRHRAATTATPIASRIRAALRRDQPRATQVQIYEAVMADAQGAHDHGPALRRRSYVKDNRLLPRGFDKATARRRHRGSRRGRT